MAEIWKPQSKEVYNAWIAALYDEASEKLSKWESEFLESLDQRLNKYNKDLSQKQADILERIYTEKTK